MLFGIEVVIIEPGTAKTAIYDKGEKGRNRRHATRSFRNVLKNWTLPRLLPVRMLDARLAKAFGFTKP
jgi:hypothetical protein